jgi:hypothetical protein
MTDKQKYAAVVVVALLVGWWAGAAGSRDRQPLEDRPVLRWIARAAKSLLWVAVFVEEPPHETHAEIRSHIGADGYVQIDHGRGW